MKLLTVPDPTESSVSVYSLTGRETLAYKCPNSKVICVISRVDGVPFKRFGFVPLSDHGYGPTFCGVTFWESAAFAAKNRKVYSFTSYSDFAKALYNNTIL